MNPGFRLRLYILTALVLSGFGVLASRLYEFQIERQDEFLGLMPHYSTVTVREPGVRGEITDRNGVLLARNLRNREITFNLQEIAKAYKARNVEEPISRRLVKRDRMDRLEEEKDIARIVEDWTVAPLKAIGLDGNFKASALRTHYVTHKGLVPFVYNGDVSARDFARAAEHSLALPGVYLNTSPLRNYPYGALASHVIGYIKPWATGNIPDADRRKYDHYVGDPYGDAGVEKSMDHILRGQEGTTELLKDDKGRVIRMLDRVPPAAGATVKLTLDARVQYYVENILRKYTGRAAAVVMDVNTGEVIAMASVPDFQLNDFVPTVSNKRWAEYTSNNLIPLGNRCTLPYAPGSTFKPATAIAGFLEHKGNSTFSCEGSVTYGNIPIRCWIGKQSHGSHGSLTLPKAIQVSCNPYFMKLANATGIDGLVRGMQMVGLGKPTGIELPDEKSGIVPGSRAWRLNNPNRTMGSAQIAMTAIGQGYSMATPLQLCAMTACIANGGKYFQPRIVKSAASPDGHKVIEDKPKLVVDLIQSGVDPKDMALLRKGMWMSVNQPGGTGGRARIPGVEIAGKTGTAETVDKGKKSHNSWLIAFGPFENPKYAICVLVQNGGSGGKVCGPIGQLIFRGLFAQDEGIRLPLRPQTAYAGNTNRIEETVLPKDDPLAASLSQGEDIAGETGDEIESPDAPPPPATPEPVLPTPALTPEAGDSGAPVPRAEPVPDEEN